jgi:hypothetical protein
MLLTLNNLLMKINENVYYKMKSDLRVIIKAYGLSELKFTDLSISDFYTIWHFVYMNRRYSDDNRNVKFINGKRLLSMDDNYVYYPCDTNDDTLLTGLKKAIKEILN